MQIRKMELKDLEEVADLEKDLFSDPWSLKSFHHEINNNRLAHYYILEDQDEIIGYFGFIIVLDECQIYNIAVSKEHQKMGYGKKMIEYIIDFCKKEDVKWIILEVREYNFPALELYMKYGFKKAARIEGYYHHPLEDGILMKLELRE